MHVHSEGDSGVQTISVSLLAWGTMLENGLMDGRSSHLSLFVPHYVPGYLSIYDFTFTDSAPAEKSDE